MCLVSIKLLSASFVVNLCLPLTSECRLFSFSLVVAKGADFSARCYASEFLHSIRTLTLYAVLWCLDFHKVQVYDFSEECYRIADNWQSIEVVIGYRNDFHKYFRKIKRINLYFNRNKRIKICLPVLRYL